ncbi:MAG: hypothetical protein AMJ53_03640 [Gammaproteobacteria bacterium SG8_11]|nr:MAG: hypothetical protein AMJ53_03640 [Gammaproteobacteria bacterium SG8_11]
MQLFPGFKVVSFFPGRLKLRVDKVKDNQPFADKVEKDLRGLISIRLIEADAMSGNVLIKYDKKTFKNEKNVDDLVSTLQALFPDLDAGKLKSWLT